MPEIRPSAPYNYQPPSEQTPEEVSGRSLRNIISTVALFLAAPLLALVLILFVIQSYEVDGPSMQETLHNKDLLIVEKLPRTMARITGKDYIPPRYEIIIFSRDESGIGQGARQLVKRVIGLPGERVTVNNGKVTVFNTQHPNGFNPDEGQEYAKTITTTAGNDVDIIVREGEVFVLGDNRDNSLDSRYFGNVASKDIVGKLGIRIFPLSKARTF